MSSKQRQFNRQTKLNQARARFNAAHAVASATATLDGGPTSESQNAVAKRVVSLFTSNMSEYRERLAAAGKPDGAVYVLVPDADDRVALRAAADVAALDGRPDDADMARNIASNDMAVLLLSRDEALQATTGWHPSNHELLRGPRPTGSLTIIYDGTACGHAVVLAVPGSVGSTAVN